MKTLRTPPATAQRQRGVILFIALIMLVVMTMAGLSMMRTINGATLMSGNIAFRQGAANSGDEAIQAAALWLQGNPSLLTGDAPGDGYYSKTSSPAGHLDLTGDDTPGNITDDFDWSTMGKELLAADASGNTMSYVIQRMCTNTGPIDTTKCAVVMGNNNQGSNGISQGQSTGGRGNPTGVIPRAYYRITVQVTSARSTHAYIQAIVVQ